MEFLDPELDAYVVRNTQSEPKLLADLNRETNQKVLMPRMLAGHLQGRVLSMLTHMIRPKYVLDVGTYTGYSALCFAEGLAEGGMIHSIDINDELSWIHDKYIGGGDYRGRISLHTGNALDIIPTLEYDWDIVFLDADKENYSNYYDLVIDKMKPGSYVLADNVLWSGKVLDDENNMDEETLGLHQFNRKVLQDDRVENVLFPIRDGLNVIRKK